MIINYLQAKHEYENRLYDPLGYEYIDYEEEARRREERAEIEADMMLERLMINGGYFG